MAFDVFLKLDGIEGESTDTAHPKEIDVLAFAFGASNAGAPPGAGGGAGAGKVQFQDLSFVMRTNKASPALLQRTADGKQLKTGTLSVRKAGGGKQQDYLTIKLSNVSVTSYQASGTEDGDPTESVSLAFSKMEYEYKLIDAKGSVSGSYKFGWDLKTGKKI